MSRLLDWTCLLVQIICLTVQTEAYSGTDYRSLSEPANRQRGIRQTGSHCALGTETRSRCRREEQKAFCCKIDIPVRPFRNAYTRQLPAQRKRHAGGTATRGRRLLPACTRDLIRAPGQSADAYPKLL